MRNGKIFWLAMASAILCTNSFAQSGSEKQPDKNNDKSANKTNAEETAPKAATTDPNYVIGPDDELIVTVWREPDISRTVPVRPDGKISLPLLNDVQATGLTPMQLSTDITNRLTKYISSPQVTVIVTRVSAQRIYVLGEVARAGAYPMVPAMTVLEALSSAGGLTPFAKQTKIYVLRTENGKQTKLPVNYKDILNGRHADQNVPLKAGDTIVVP